MLSTTMPTPATAKLPKLRNADEFEELVVDVLRLRWQDPNAQRFGRNGQAQHGVDVVGRPLRLRGATAGGQAKNTDSLSLADVVTEVEKARAFPGGLAEFYVVTSRDRDAPLLAAVRQHFATTPAPFPVEMIFWEDIVAEIAVDGALVTKHWKGFGPQASIESWRNQIVVVRAEAKRMHKQADALNRGIYGGFWKDHIRDKFRPEALERAMPHVAVEIAKHEALRTNLDSLRGSVAAADAETDRILNGQVLHLVDLRELVLRVLNDAFHVVHNINQIYGDLIGRATL